MKKITAIIVDDEPEARDILTGLLTDFSDIEVVGKENSVDNALPAILKMQPDIVFLDIDMPNKNGFELIRELKHYDAKPTIIFVTAFGHFAIDAIKYSAFDYIMKPIDIDDLQMCISRYKAEINKQHFTDKIDNLLSCIKKEKIRFNTRDGFIFIDPDEIVYCAADRNYTDIYLNQNNVKQTVTLNIGSMLNVLPGHFSRINRSNIVNRYFLEEVNRKSRKCILMSSFGKLEFDIPKKYIKQLESL